MIFQGIKNSEHENTLPRHHGKYYICIHSLSLFQMSSNADLISYATGFELCNRVVIADFLSFNLLLHNRRAQTSGLETWLMSWDDVKLEFTRKLIVSVNRDVAKVMDMHDTQRSLSQVATSRMLSDMTRWKRAAKMRRTLVQYVIYENKLLPRFERLRYSAFPTLSFESR